MKYFIDIYLFNEIFIFDVYSVEFQYSKKYIFIKKITFRKHKSLSHKWFLKLLSIFIVLFTCK